MARIIAKDAVSGIVYVTGTMDGERSCSRCDAEQHGGAAVLEKLWTSVGTWTGLLSPAGGAEGG